MRTWASVAISFLLLLSLAGVGGCTGEGSTTPQETPPAPPFTGEGSTTETAPAPPFTMEVSFPHGAPPLNQTAELVCVVKADINIENLSLEIILPEGFELVSGGLSWTGDILTGGKGGQEEVEVEVIKAAIRSVKVGNWTIELAGYLDPEENAGLGLNGPGPICYVSVSEDSAEWGKYPPWGKKGGYPVPVEREKAPSGGA